MHIQITRLVSRAWKELAKRSVEDVGSSLVRVYPYEEVTGSDGIKFNSSEIRKVEQKRFVDWRYLSTVLRTRRNW